MKHIVHSSWIASLPGGLTHCTSKTLPGLIYSDTVSLKSRGKGLAIGKDAVNGAIQTCSGSETFLLAVNGPSAPCGCKPDNHSLRDPANDFNHSVSGCRAILTDGLES